jgi:Beta protein
MAAPTLTEALQLRLEKPDWFAPVPLESRHYVAALQTKWGELNALRRAEPEVWERLTPLLQVLGPKTQKGPLRPERISNWVKVIAQTVGSRPCFLDILRLRPTRPTVTKPGNQQPVLSSIYAAARRRGMMFVPVLPLGGTDGKGYVKLVADAALCDGRGVALRYPLLHVALRSGKTHADVLSDALEAVAVDVTHADVLVDLGHLSEDETLEPEDVAADLAVIMALGAWRSVVLLGTSMPSMLGGGVIGEGVVGALPRREWKLWAGLRDAKVGRLPTYGDYAVQHPTPPEDENGGGNTMRGNIRYTVAETTLIARGEGPIRQAGNEQYRELCQMLVARNEFAGRDFSWGDEVIYDCAAGTGDVGTQNLWRGAGTSHHLRQVVEQVT